MNAATRRWCEQKNVKLVPLLDLADLLHRRDQPRAVFRDEF
jgi:hypothetical protein